MDSYWVEKRAVMCIGLDDEHAGIGTAPTLGRGARHEGELDRISANLHQFNDLYAPIFTDQDRINKRIRDEILPKPPPDRVEGATRTPSTRNPWETWLAVA